MGSKLSFQEEGFVVDLEGFGFRFERNSSRRALISALDSSGEVEGILECLDDLFALVVSQLWDGI